MNLVSLFLIIVSLPLLLGGCGGEKKESVVETKPVEEMPINPNLKYEIKDDEVTITGCDKKASSELTIPATIEGKPVTSIGERAFYYCEGLTTITIPDGVTSIGDGAFRGCRSLTIITIPDGVTSIGERAFYYCEGLTSITIPDSVSSIGMSAFTDCKSLATIEIGAGNVNFTEVNGVLFNAEKTVLLTYPASKEGANYTIPDSVASIGELAFSRCNSLTSITIPDSVTSIGDLAFWGCEGLTSITIPDSVTSIGRLAFYNCKSLKSITIPDGVTSIGDSAFNRSALTSITIPDSVTSIGNWGFYGCESLTSITIGDGVTSIGNYAFARCKSLTTVTFLGDAPKVVENAFEEASPTIYRKPEAEGWGDTWGGRPVKLISEKP